MPEGHTVHRTANQFSRMFKGNPIQVSSPQGRFTDAKLIDGRVLKRAWAIGKQMFLTFDNNLTLRIHLGIYGKWSFVEKAGDDVAAEPVGQVRVRFLIRNSEELAYADLRGPTVCEVIGADEVKAVERRLGPDPLNPDSKGLEAARFIERASKTSTAIGLVLMNQEMIAGIGNVYRAEILFRAGINPHTPAKQLTREQLSDIWVDSVELLKVGVAKGVMITRNELFKKRPTKAERNFVYKREGLPCRVCETHVVIEIMGGRKLYWCPSCQK